MNVVVRGGDTWTIGRTIRDYGHQVTYPNGPLTQPHDGP
jgi:hypothetical protein